MAYVFVQSETAKMRLGVLQDANTRTLDGINPEEENAQVIVRGISSLLSCASLSGYFPGAIRTSEDEVVYEED